MKPLLVMTPAAVCAAFVGLNLKPSFEMLAEPPSMTSVPLNVVSIRVDWKLVLVMRSMPPPSRKPNGFEDEPLVNAPPSRNSEPAAMFLLWGLAEGIVTFRLIMLVPDELVKVADALFKVIGLPLSVKPPLLNATQPLVRLEMLLVLFGCVVPLKIRLSALVGAVPTQLAAVLQLASLPRPDQVLLAPWPCGTSKPNKNAQANMPEILCRKITMKDNYRNADGQAAPCHALSSSHYQYPTMVVPTKSVC